MFRPIPEAVLFRTIPHRLIASVLLLGALACTALLLLSLERENVLLVILLSAISVAAVVMSLYYDSTKRTLEEVKSLARNILESIPTGVLSVNRYGVVTAVNPAAETVFKRRAADLLGHSYESVFAGGEIIRQVLDGALTSHSHMTEKDVPYEGINGRLQTIRVSTVELRQDDGQPAGVLLQAQDVTEWLGLEHRVRIAEKLAALHTLSAGVAHELRNPLSAMDLNLHLLQEELQDHGPITGRTAHYLQVLDAECRRLAAILDNLLKFARPTSLDPRQVDVYEVITHIAALMQLEAHEHKIHLEHAIGSDLPPVAGDQTQISQVLVNVLVNAFHAMREGGRCHVAATTCNSDGKCWVDICVRDTGVGIPQDALPRLFDPFYTTKASGSGLGLAIAYRIMQNHGGSINVSSALGTGTAVTLRFPALAARPKKTEATS